MAGPVNPNRTFTPTPAISGLPWPYGPMDAGSLRNMFSGPAQPVPFEQQSGLSLPWVPSGIMPDINPDQQTNRILEGWNILQDKAVKPALNAFGNAGQAWLDTFNTPSTQWSTIFSPETNALSAFIDTLFPKPTPTVGHPPNPTVNKLPEEDPAAQPGPSVWDLLKPQAPALTKGPSYETPLIDYTAGFPEAPQMAPTDWSAINEQFDKSRPAPPTLDKSQAWMAFLGAAAQAASGTHSFAQALAAAGGGGLLGLLEQRQRDQLMEEEYKKNDSKWQAAKAQLMQAQTSADQEVARANMDAAYKSKLELFKLQLQNQQQMQTDVQVSGDTVMVKQFNPNTGKLEISTYRYSNGNSLLDSLRIMKLLSPSGKVDLGIFGSLEDINVPPALKAAHNVAIAMASGFLPPSVFGDAGSVIQKVIDDARMNGEKPDEIIAKINGLLMTEEGQPLLSQAIDILQGQ